MFVVCLVHGSCHVSVVFFVHESCHVFVECLINGSCHVFVVCLIHGSCHVFVFCLIHCREFSGACSVSSGSGEYAFLRQNSSHFNGIKFT